jgi:hypothetical protein
MNGQSFHILSTVEHLQLLLMAILDKLVYRFGTISAYQNPSWLFAETDKLILKLIWKKGIE